MIPLLRILATIEPELTTLRSVLLEFRSDDPDNRRKVVEKCQETSTTPFARHPQEYAIPPLTTQPSSQDRPHGLFVIDLAPATQLIVNKSRYGFPRFEVGIAMFDSACEITP